jgi:hypothetical protein
MALATILMLLTAVVVLIAERVRGRSVGTF